jgi:hypothetical protein
MSELTGSFIATVLDGASTQSDMRAAAKQFVKETSHATAREADAALCNLTPCLKHNDFSRAGIVALVCGALVERGADSTPINGALIQWLRNILKLAIELADVCQAQLPSTPDKDEDPGESFELIRKQVAVSMPNQNAAWEALQQFWPAAIAIFSASPGARAAARDLCGLAVRIATLHAGGHWIRFMLSVLDNEPILVLEPSTRLGLLGRISGVVDNFQLNVLLMDEFPRSGFFTRRRVPQSAVDIARGVGPQQSEEIVTGVWNLYTWQALDARGVLPTSKEVGAHWIWNEGVPKDIPMLEGRRVILLGPSSYVRTWRAQRLFDKLPARLETERVLKGTEVSEWLVRLSGVTRLG